MSYIGM